MGDGHQPTEEDMREQFVAGAMVTGFAYSRDEAGDDWANWLTSHDAQVAAQALRDASHFTTGTDVRFESLDDVHDWLRDRADRLIEGVTG